MVEFGFEEWGRERIHFDLRKLKLIPAAASAGLVKPPRQKGLDIARWVNAYRPTLDGKPIAVPALRKIPQPCDPS